MGFLTSDGRVTLGERSVRFDVRQQAKHACTLHPARCRCNEPSRERTVDRDIGICELITH
jgi:hypothetical protein